MHRPVATLGAEDLLVIDVTQALALSVLGGMSIRASLTAQCLFDLWWEKCLTYALTRSLLGDSGMCIAWLADTGDATRFRIIADPTMAVLASGLFARSIPARELSR